MNRTRERRRKNTQLDCVKENSYCFLEKYRRIRRLFASIIHSLMWYSKLSVDLYRMDGTWRVYSDSSFDQRCKGHRWHSFRQKHFQRYRYSIAKSEIRQLPLVAYLYYVIVANLYLTYEQRKLLSSIKVLECYNRKRNDGIFGGICNVIGNK